MPLLKPPGEFQPVPLPKEIVDQPFTLAKDVVSSKEAYLAKLASADRVQAETHYLLNGVELYAWVFYGGLKGKIWKCACQADPKAHPKFAGRLTYHDTVPEALTVHAALCKEIEAAGGKSTEEVKVADGK